MSTGGKMKRDTSQRIPDELVDAFFDRELDEGSREKFFGMLRGDLDQCAKVARTQRIISTLREPIEAPDLTDSIMRGVAKRRGFVPARLRSWVKAGRLAVAASVVLAMLGVAVLHRYGPESLTLTERPQPVSRVVSSSAQEASAGVQQLAGAVGAMKAKISEPAAELGRLLAAEDFPEIESADGLSAARVYLVGGLTPDGAVPMEIRAPAGSSLALPGGAGSDVQFVVPSVVYLDSAGSSSGASAHVPPLRGDRGQSAWVGMWRENLFVFQQVDGAGEAEGR